MTGRWSSVVKWARISALGLVVLCVCSSTASAIFLGTPLTSDQYSGVGMLLPTAGHPLGTGTMLSRFVFLTAAQNVRDPSLDPTVYEFSLGPGISAHATEIRLHPGFDTIDGINLAFDVALVKLNEAEVLTWPGFSQSAIREALTPVGALGTGVGFGENLNDSGSGVKRSGSFSVNGYLSGADAFGSPIGDAFIEMIPGDVVPQWIGRGDAGGPLFFEGQIAGVASFRFVASTEEEGPSYYVSLHNHADWIRENLNEMDPSVSEPVPEPGTLTILGSGLIGLVVARLRPRIPAGHHRVGATRFHSATCRSGTRESSECNGARSNGILTNSTTGAPCHRVKTTTALVPAVVLHRRGHPGKGIVHGEANL